MHNLSKSKLDDKISMFVGMDLHKNYLQIAVMSDKGKVLERRNHSYDYLLKSFLCDRFNGE